MTLEYFKDIIEKDYEMISGTLKNLPYCGQKVNND